jgi:hypothetical protein
MGSHEVGTSPSFVGRWCRRVITFHIVCLAWIFFRAPSIRGAWTQLSSLGTWQWLPVYGVALQFLAFYSCLLFLIDLQLEVSGGEYLFESRPVLLRIAAGMMICILTTLFGANQENAFIYFRF